MRAGKLIFIVAGLCVIGTVLFVIVSLIWNFAVLGVARGLGLNPEYFSNGMWLLGLLIIFLPKRFFRLKRPTSIKATQIIFSPIEEVWDQVNPRPRRDYFLPSTPEIRAVEGEEDAFDYVIPAAQNGPMKGSIALRQRVVGRSAPNFLALFLENGADVDYVNIDAEASEYSLKPIDPDTTSVMLTTTVSHISPLYLLTLMIVHPAKDALKRLKSVCEGTPDTSWVGRIVAKLDEEPQQGVGSDSVIVLTTVVIVMSALVFGTVMLLLALAPAN